MDTENEKLILDGNAFYEIDLTCIQKREAEKSKPKSQQKEAGQNSSLKKLSSIYKKGDCL